MCYNILENEDYKRILNDPNIILDSLNRYRQKSISITPDELQEEMDDSEDLLLVGSRFFLEHANLTPEQRIILAESDKRIADKMKPETLQDYINEHPQYSIRKWWKKKS